MALRGVSVERVLPVSPQAVFALLADPYRHHELDGSGTLRGGVDGPSRLSLGARFGMDMRVVAPYRMVNTVVEFEPDRRIAWQARPPQRWLARVIGGRIWRYELEPVPGGTRVRETWDISQEALPVLVRPLRAATRLSMQRTMDRIERLVA